MQRITIIYPPNADWYMLHQRPQQLLKAFSRLTGFRSIFMSSERHYKLPRPIVKLNDDLFVVKQKASYDHLILGKRVLWFSKPAHYIYAKNKKFDLVVFDAIDNPVDEFAVWKKKLPQAVQYADLISCTSKVLYNYHNKSGKPCFLCPNGADYHHFKIAQHPLQRPKNYPAFPDSQKVIGFYGAMARWLDFELIRKIARKHKVVLIGHNKAYPKIIRQPNIVNIPHVDYSVLPYYLAQFDLAIIPFKLTEMTKGCDPIKFYEYISAGKPVLATKMNELIKFRKIIYFIDHTNYEEVIKKALAEDSPLKREERIQTARANSWNARVIKAAGIIRRYINR